MPVKYALDSNLFIDAFRSEAEEAELIAFHDRFAPVEHMASVVAFELRAGARTESAATKLERFVLRPFEHRGRTFAPSHGTWKEAGAAMSKLGGDTSQAFCNDVLLAASCREHGVTLVTRDLKDFRRIQAVMRFEFVPAWP